MRQIGVTLPSGTNSRTYKVHNNAISGDPSERTADDPCTAGWVWINQAGRLSTDRAADPDGAGPGLAVQRQYIYDSAGRTVATRAGWASGTDPDRLGTQPWTCTTYDTRGRTSTTTFPARGTQPARTVTYDYAVGGNPLVTSVSDAAGTITTTVDLLGRVTSTTDVWGITTTTVYDAAGRVSTTTTTGQAALGYTYDNAGRVETVALGGNLVADPNYDAYGRLDTVSYPSGTGNAGNGTTGTFDLDTLARRNNITWKDAANNTMTSDQVTRGSSGKISDQTIDGVDVNPAGLNYVYDQAGRLTTAHVRPGATTAQEYDFADTTGCGANGSGKNTNRNKLTDNGTTTNYCYDNADRITSSTNATVGTVTYDNHGNTTAIFGETHVYDSADRHMATTKAAVTVTYIRDALDRIVQRTDGTTTVRYAFTGSTDSSSYTLDATNAVVERTIGLPGGAMITTRTTGNIWSCPNIHGDTAVTADQTGTKQGVTRTYDPYGNPIIGTIPDNSAGDYDYGWLGQHQRGTEHQNTLQPIIEMGARQYSQLLGRFIEVDPIEGGNCNDYDYVCGDPVNQTDLDGKICFSCVVRAVVHVAKRAAPIVGLAAFGACIVASAGVCAAAGAVALGFSATANLGGCAVRGCSRRGWVGAVGATAGEWALNRFGGVGVRARIPMQFSSSSLIRGVQRQAIRRVQQQRFVRHSSAYVGGLLLNQVNR